MSQKQPSKLEMAILSLLWEHGELTAREVLEALPDGKQRAYTSVLSVLQAMERKGFVGHSLRGMAHAYFPKAHQDETVGAVLREMVRDMFGGSTAGAVQHLLLESDVSEEELQAMERLVAEHRKRRHATEES